MTAASRRALAVLRELHRSGRLVREIRRVPALLAVLEGEELLRAGSLLAWSAPGPAADRAGPPHGPPTDRPPGARPVRVALAGDVPPAAALPPLAVELARGGRLLRAAVSPPGTWAYDLADPASGVYASRPDLTLCLVDPGALDRELAVPSGPEGFRRAAADHHRLLSSLLEVHQRVGTGLLLTTTLPRPDPAAPAAPAAPADPADPSAPSGGGADGALLGGLWREANARVLRLTSRFPRLAVVDLERYGAARPRQPGAGPFDERLLLLCARQAARLVGRRDRPRRGDDDREHH
ncbi:hypothetical protein [Kitasatospora fiedleri]|uniref:hypothetical protein n=1 Tax=Kitasatospora fiedleri TaxID=2991545 RepID=UPI00249BFCBD|nr:hypothetical protein [Kitasatospora fiedleri]